MTRLITWSLIILTFGLGITWMVRSAQANPRPLPQPEKTPAAAPTEPAKPEPSFSEKAGTAARSAVDQAKDVGAQVVEQTSAAASEVSAASKDAAAKAKDAISETAQHVSDAAKQAAEKASKVAGEFAEGFNKPAEPAAAPAKP